MRCFLTLLFIPLFLAATADAQFLSRNEAGIGFTDNANLESSATDSDFFYRLSTSNRYRTGAHQLGLRLGLTDYFQENINDHISWRLSDHWRSQDSKWSVSGAALGQQYLQAEPGFTESAFNFVGWDLSAERSYKLSRKTEIRFSPIFAGRYFTSAVDRKDHKFAGAAEIEYVANRSLILGGRSELGWIFSNNADYRLNYFELSGNSDWDFSPGWALFNELGFLRTNFHSRTISDETLVSNRRGAGRVRISVTHEAYNMVFFYSELLRKLRPSLDTGLSWNHVQQSSRSGIQNYSVNEIFGRLIYSF